jgi:ribosome-binding factor A
MGTQRLERIAEAIQRELAELIRLEVRDPRVRFVTLTGVELSRDQSHAKVYFTVMGTPEDTRAALEGLGRAAGFLRSALSHRLTTRTVPALGFAYDASVERGARLTRLIEEANAPVVPAPARSRRTPRRKKA